MSRGWALAGALLAAAAVADEPPAPGTEWYGFAAPFYLPETRIGLGALGGVHFRACAGCRTSSVHVQAAYTQNDQFVVQVVPQVYASPAFVATAQLSFGLFPDRFWGIGPDTPGGDGEPFTPRYADAVWTPEWYVLPARLRVGPKLHFRHEQIVVRQAGGVLESGAVEGARGSTVVGLGASATWDTRDNQFQPAAGTYVEASYGFYPGRIGGHRDFGRAALDGRLFTTIAPRHVLAWEARLEAAHGEVPFTLLPELGGDHLLRGYREGRWRDHVYAAVQAEWRFPVVGRLSGVAFAGVGSVAGDLGSLPGAPLRAAGGAGARFRLTQDGVNLRADVALGQDGPELYLIVLEAF